MKKIRTRPYAFRDAEMLHQKGVHPVLSRLFASRGVSDTSALSTELKRLIPPSQLTHAQDAAKMLADAIHADKKMLIVADYDCDGATACAVGIRGLRAMGAKVDYLVPNRFEYGYGLTPAIVALAKEKHAPDIIITVDNGIASIDGVQAANEQQIDVLITDHHLPADETPEAKVIVNPNQRGCDFPSKSLAGVGVIFYVMIALRTEMRDRGVFDIKNQPQLDQLLDLVALGTITDVVHLDTNNRLMVAQGIERMRKGNLQAGIAALFRVAGRQASQATTSDLGFAIGPRLNAAGRMDDMSIGIECLITDDVGYAWELAHKLNDINVARRQKENEMQESAKLQLEDYAPENQHTLCAVNPEWHQGIVGLLASRLKDRFYRPTITFAPADNGELRGSGRSIPQFHLRDALDLVSKKHPELIEKFGGHAMAAGLSIKAENYLAFAKAFETAAQEMMQAEWLEQTVHTDGELEDAYFNLNFIQLLDDQIWGQGFPHPTFSDTFTIKNQRLLKGKHLKLSLSKNGQNYDAIWFNRDTHLDSPAYLAYRLSSNEFNGKTTVQLMIDSADHS